MADDVLSFKTTRSTRVGVLDFSALEAIGVSFPRYVLDESAPANVGNLYNNWTDLLNDLNATSVEGLKYVEIVGLATVAVGTWDMERVILAGSLEDSGMSRLEVPDNAVLNNLSGVVQGLTLASTGATIPITFTGIGLVRVFVMEYNAELISEGGAELMEISSGSIITVLMMSGSKISAPTGAATNTITLSTGALLQLLLYDAAQVEPDAIGDDGSANLALSFRTLSTSVSDQANFSGTLNEGGVANFDDANRAFFNQIARFGPWQVSDSIQAAGAATIEVDPKTRRFYDGTMATTLTYEAPSAKDNGTRFGVKNATAGVAATVTIDGNGSDIEDPASPGTFAATVTMSGAGLGLTWEYKESSDRWYIVERT